MENSIKIQEQSFAIALPKKEQSRIIMDILTRAVLIAGIKPSNEEIEVMILEVTELIRTRYPNLTISEISETIKSGAMGDYAESYLSVRNINSWLKACNIERIKRLAQIEKKKQDSEHMPIVERGNFLLSNIDKLPSLKKLMEKTDSKRK